MAIKIYIRNPNPCGGPLREPKPTGKWKEVGEDGREFRIEVEVSYLAPIQERRVTKYLFFFERVEFITPWKPTLIWVPESCISFTEVREFQCS